MAAGGLSRHSTHFHFDRHAEQAGIHACSDHRLAGAGPEVVIRREGAMATEKTDVVIVGMGAVGGILAAELGKAGMKVIGLERGPRLTTADFSAQDELRYFQRQDLRPNAKRQPVTWRPNTKVRATPMPVLNYGNQAGGGTVHYGAVSWRFHEDDF